MRAIPTAALDAMARRGPASAAFVSAIRAGKVKEDDQTIREETEKNGN